MRSNRRPTDPGRPLRAGFAGAPFDMEGLRARYDALSDSPEADAPEVTYLGSSHYDSDGGGELGQARRDFETYQDDPSRDRYTQLNEQAMDDNSTQRRLGRFFGALGPGLARGPQGARGAAAFGPAFDRSSGPQAAKANQDVDPNATQAERPSLGKRLASTLSTLSDERSKRNVRKSSLRARYEALGD